MATRLVPSRCWAGLCQATTTLPYDEAGIEAQQRNDLAHSAMGYGNDWRLPAVLASIEIVEPPPYRLYAEVVK